MQARETSDCGVGFASPGSADEHHVALMLDEASGGEVTHQRFINVGNVKVEVFKVFGERELGDGKLILDRARLFLVDFRGEQVTDHLLGFMLTLHRSGEDAVVGTASRKSLRPPMAVRMSDRSITGFSSRLS